MEERGEHGLGVLVQWAFTPGDFFEDAVTIRHGGCAYVITSGRVEARIPGNLDEPATAALVQQLEEALHGYFLAAQLVRQRRYELSRDAVIELRPDGTRNVHIEVGEAVMVIEGHAPRVVIKGLNETVKYDSEAESIGRTKSLAELMGKHFASDAVLASMMRSFDAAMRDPDNELVHLYEIRDAVKGLISRDGAKSLGVAKDALSRFGTLCNAEPVRQGRHRGSHAGFELRDATECELQEARSTASALIEGYARQLEDGALKRGEHGG